MEMSFCQLKNKDVINVCDGKNYGKIIDLVFDTCCGKVLGIIVPANKNFFQIFKSSNDILIPYNRICKIGKDIILVDIIMQNNCSQFNNINICSEDTNKKDSTQIKPKFNIQDVLNDIDLNK